MLKNTLLKCITITSMLTLVVAYITGDTHPVRSCIAAGIAILWIIGFVYANGEKDEEGIE